MAGDIDESLAIEDRIAEAFRHQIKRARYAYRLGWGGTYELIRHQIRAGRSLSDAKAGQPLPAILINTMGKVGSVFLWRTLATSLSVEEYRQPIAHGFFSTDTATTK